MDAEDAMPPALPRSPSATSISPGGPILAFFWDLASIDEEKRLAASESLLDALQEAQQTHEEKTPGEACVELVYTVRRLVRGLASPRDGARQGFGAALIEVLCVFERQVTVESVLELMNNSMQLQGSMKGPEERDVLFGRVFTCAAIVRSHRLERLPAARRAALAPQVCAELLACAAKKSFLQEVAAATLCDALRQLPAAELHDGVCAPLAAQLARPLAEWSPATLLIALTLSAKLPPPAAARLLPHARLRAGRLLHAAQLPALLPALKGASCAHPRLHVVWDAILDDLVGGGAADGGDGAAAVEAAEADEAPQRAGKKKKKGKAAAAVPNGVADHGGGDGGGANGTSEGDLQLVRSFWQVVVADGLVHPNEKAMLAEFAAAQHVTPAAHRAALGACGWTEAEFDHGVRQSVMLLRQNSSATDAVVGEEPAG